MLGFLVCSFLMFVSQVRKGADLESITWRSLGSNSHIGETDNQIFSMSLKAFYPDTNYLISGCGQLMTRPPSLQLFATSRCKHLEH